MLAITQKKDHRMTKHQHKNMVTVEKARDMTCCRNGLYHCDASGCMGWRTACWTTHDGIKVDSHEEGAVEYGYCAAAGRP